MSAFSTTPTPAPSGECAPSEILEDNCVPPISLHADKLMELFEAESERLQAIHEDRLRQSEEQLMAKVNAELFSLRQTVQHQRTLLEQMAGTQHPPALVPSPEGTNIDNIGAVEPRVESISASEEVSRMKQAIEAVGFVYVDGSIQFTPRSAHSTEFIVGLFSSAVEHCRQSGIQSEHLTRAEELIAGPVKPADFWEVLELMAHLPRLHNDAEDERTEATVKEEGALQLNFARMK
ncbi:hypothetical protein D9619_007950 [Psilocybe cf. subviscida]|uniref:Uncharacterized protein n=1 Tax=Psilocybe cf. subviscida TaxID=2480587 RepID=A0A8H5AV21_9AGAR|nr:hypothetical protein D9619_007950 [Psilocybe cf. subviscida]